MFSSSGSGKKPPSQQEMVQVDRSDSTSPFWRHSQRDPAGKKGGSNTAPGASREAGIVVGAQYSHADLLRFDSLNLSNNPPRSRTPPPPSSTKGHHATGSMSPTSAGTVQPFRNYKSFLSNTDDDWNADEADDDVYGYEEDDGDDFGLPSLSSMKRRTRRKAAAAAAAAQSGGSSSSRRNGPGAFGSGYDGAAVGSDRLASAGSMGSTGDLAADAFPPIRRGDMMSGGGGGGGGGGRTHADSLGSPAGGGAARRFSNSGDIAVERPAPSYPMPKKSEGKILRPQYKDILRDPANALHLIRHSAAPAGASPREVEAVSARLTRINRFKRLLQASTIPLAELRKLAWSGVPQEVRAMTWQLLLSYLPTSSERRVATLERKRKEYLDGVRQAFEGGASGSGSGSGSGAGGGVGVGAGAGAGPSSGGRNKPGAGTRGLDEAVWHQISIDVPRTNPHIELYGYEATQRSLERILYVWAVRHPASGYVQGINDLVTPFWQVFLGVYISDPDIETGMDPGQLPRAVLDAVEADAFWCLTKLLDGIQDHYIVAQPGIQRQVAALRDLTRRIDQPLAAHLEKEHVEFIQFSFRWMNCLLMREVSVKNTIRMWDTYMAEENGFSEFHLYVCAAFLVKWSAKLCDMDFQEIMMFLQSLPTREWDEKDIELLLSEAFIWQSLFKGSSAHLRGPSRAPSTSLQL